MSNERGSNVINPNDILIRFTKNPEGKVEREMYLGVCDESLLPEMQKVSEFIRNCMTFYDTSDTAIEYAEAIQHADNLVKPSAPRIKLLNS